MRNSGLTFSIRRNMRNLTSSCSAPSSARGCTHVGPKKLAPSSAPVCLLFGRATMDFPVIIPVGMDYTATVQASTLKPVTCEQCNQEYFYQMTRSAFGESRSVLFINMEGAKNRA